MSERWFLALWPDPGTRAALAAQLAALPPFEGRPTHPLDWHLTLAFLGELEPDGLQRLLSVAAQANAPTFDLKLERIGHFARSRILWCAPARPVAPLTEVVDRLGARLAEAGFVPDSRPYRPHLTLARKVPRALELDLPETVRWPVTELVLACGQGGIAPRYRIQGRWPLGRAAVLNLKNFTQIFSRL